MAALQGPGYWKAFAASGSSDPGGGVVLALISLLAELRPNHPKSREGERPERDGFVADLA